MSGRIAVIGFGSPLMQDDGVGIYVINKLAARPLPEHITVVDGGTSSFAVLAAQRDAERIIIVDAVTGSGPPGSIYRLTGEELVGLALPDIYSMHECSLPQSLMLAAKIGPLPPVILYGIEPEQVDYGLELTPSVRAAAENLIKHILQEYCGDTGCMKCRSHRES